MRECAVDHLRDKKMSNSNTSAIVVTKMHVNLSDFRTSSRSRMRSTEQLDSRYSMLFTVARLLHSSKSFARHSSTSSYTQGQAPPDRSDVREYFYYIDSFGQVRLLAFVSSRPPSLSLHSYSWTTSSSKTSPHVTRVRSNRSLNSMKMRTRRSFSVYSRSKVPAFLLHSITGEYVLRSSLHTRISVRIVVRTRA